MQMYIEGPISYDTKQEGTTVPGMNVVGNKVHESHSCNNSVKKLTG